MPLAQTVTPALRFTEKYGISCLNLAFIWQFSSWIVMLLFWWQENCCHLIEKVTVVVQLQVLNFPLTTFPALFSSGFGFLAYETFKEAILGMNGALTKVNKETGDTVLTPFGGLVCGALAGASSQTVAWVFASHNLLLVCKLLKILYRVL